MLCVVILASTETEKNDGGPTQNELLDMLHSFDISASRSSSSVNSRAPSPSPSLFNIIYPAHRQNANIPTTPIFHRMGLRGSGRQVVPIPLRSVSESPHPPASSQSVWTDGPWAGSRSSGRLQTSGTRTFKPKADISSHSDTEVPQSSLLDTPQKPLLKIPSKWSDTNCLKVVKSDEDQPNVRIPQDSLPDKVPSTSSLHVPIPIHSRTFSVPHKPHALRVNSQLDHTDMHVDTPTYRQRSYSLASSSPSLLRSGNATSFARQDIKKLLQSDLPASDC